MGCDPQPGSWNEGLGVRDSFADGFVCVRCHYALRLIVEERHGNVNHVVLVYYLNGPIWIRTCSSTIPTDGTIHRVPIDMKTWY